MFIPSCDLIRKSNIPTRVDEGRGKMDIISASIRELGSEGHNLK